MDTTPLTFRDCVSPPFRPLDPPLWHPGEREEASLADFGRLMAPWKSNGEIPPKWLVCDACFLSMLKCEKYGR